MKWLAQRLWAFARIPEALEPQAASAARFVVVAVLVSVAAVAGYSLASLFAGIAPSYTLAIALLYGLGAAASFAAMRARRVKLATHLFVIQNWGSAACFVIVEGPNTGHVGVFFIAVMLAGLLRSSWAAVGYGLAGAAVILSTKALIAIGAYTPTASPQPLWLPAVSQLCAGGFLTALLVGGLHRALSALHDSERKLSVLVENSPDGILFLDATGKCISANPAARSMLERPLQGSPGAANVRGLPVELPFHADSFCDGVHVMELPAADDSTRVIELNGIRVREEGRITGFEFILRDVTQRVRADEARRTLEARLRRVQKTEALGRMAGGVAHDFNNLLTIILGNSEVVASYPAINDEMRERLREIEDAALKAAEVTRQLLSFGRKEERGEAAVVLRPVLEGMTPMLKRFLGEGIALDLVLAQQPSVIRIDRVQLEQVLVNLVVNAQDAMLQGGRLTIELENLDVDAASSRALGISVGSWVKLQVSDTGEGMPPELISRAFEPFFTTKPEGHGSGLGLAMAEMIVSAAGGFIRLESRLGQGTTVRLFFPKTDLEPAEMPPPLRARFAGKGELVCLVEDDSALREVSRRALEKHGYRVLAVPNGPTLLKLLAASPAAPRILVTDVVLGTENGLDVASDFGALYPHVPVLYVSGYSSGLLAARGLKADQHAVLTKPYKGEALASRVRRLIDGTTEVQTP